MSKKILDSLTPAETPVGTMANGLTASITGHERILKSAAHEFEQRVKDLASHLDTVADVAGKKAGKPITKLANIVRGLDAHLDDIRDHHLGDNGKVEAANELIEDVKTALTKFKGDDAALVEGLELRFKRHGVKIPGELIRSATIPMHEEYVAQVKEHLGEKKLLGKAMSVALGTVSVGVIAHGGLNIKRGLFGYNDPETGEKKGGAFSTLVVGLGEMAAGLSSLKWALTGRWGPGRASHALKADHHHDHDHGHHHH